MDLKKEEENNRRGRLLETANGQIQPAKEDRRMQKENKPDETVLVPRKKA